MTRKGSTALLAAACALACSSKTPEEPPVTYLSHDELVDPETCKECHADHYREWSGSMHAYAADDPVFIAMNARGQRETNGDLGDFCVNCHAPMAVKTGATDDGLNLAEVPQKLKGVTCYFCHSVDAVEGEHNNPLRLADDDVLRGPFADPIRTTPHRAAYDPLFDRDQLASARLCGACHDIVTDKGAAIERTFAEWKESVFSLPDKGLTCGQCHMASTPDTPVASFPGVYSRTYHSHTFPGVDLALTAFPERTAQKAEIEEFLGKRTLASALCVSPDQGKAHVILDNVGGGHAWPSGAGQDRRAWVELIAYSGGNVAYSSGVVADGEAVTDLPDPDLWLLRDCLLDEQNQPVHMFWEAATSASSPGYESHLLPAQATFDVTDDRFYQSHVYQPYPRAGVLPATFDRVTLRVRIQPIGVDVLRDLEDSGDLEPGVKDGIETFDVGGELVEWTPEIADGYMDDGFRYTCVTKTNLAFAADKFLAPKPEACKP